MKYVVYIFALFFHKIVYSFQQTVTKAAQAVLTNDPKQRPLFSIYDTIFSSIATMTGMQILVSNVLVPKHGGEFNLSFFREFLTIIMSISFVLAILAMIGIARKDNPKYFGVGEDGTATSSLSDYWTVIKGNTPLISLAGAGMMMKFLMTLIGDQAFLVIIFGVILGNYGLSGQVSAMQIIPNLIIIFIMTRLAQNQGLKRSYTVSTILTLVSVVAVGFILWLSPDTTQIFGDGNWGLAGWLFMIFYMGLRIFGAYPTSIILTMSADISDYETARSGRFVSGFIGTIFSLTDSLSSSLPPIMIGFLLASIGFTQAYPEPNEPLTPELFNLGMLLLVVIPVILLIITLFCIYKYPLTSEAMEDVQERIAERRASASKN